jgi:hypothetical protein
MDATKLRANVRALVPARARRTAARVLHGETSAQQWLQRRNRARLATAIASGTALETSGDLCVARSVADIPEPHQVLADVADALTASGIEHVSIAAPGESKYLAIDARELPKLASALDALPHAPTWRVEVRSKVRGRWYPAAHAAQHIDHDTVSLTLRRAYVAPDGTHVEVAGRAETTLEIWEWQAGGEPRADGDAHLKGTRVPRGLPTTVPYLIEEDWRALAAGKPRPPALALPHLLEVSEPIDVVYTWVDGDDPEWARRKSAAMGEVAPEVNQTADAASRFVSRDELRYSLRSLELYAPWVRNIYVVTDGQRPDWLVDDHPRPKIVDHREIFSDPSVLPVFNSHAIESQLHHIAGLSDRYLYLNDDVFFGQPVSKETFFEANGISKFFLSPVTLDVGPASTRDLPVLSAAKHNADLIAKTWDRSITSKFKHTPHTQNRGVLEEMEQRFPEIFEQVAGSRIRHPDDYSIAAALQHYFSYALGRAVPGVIRYAYVALADAQSELTLNRMLRTRDREVFCLNDTSTDEAGQRQADRLAAWFLQEYFPLPSSFERP